MTNDSQTGTRDSVQTISASNKHRWSLIAGLSSLVSHLKPVTLNLSNHLPTPVGQSVIFSHSSIGSRTELVPKPIRSFCQSRAVKPKPNSVSRRKAFWKIFRNSTSEDVGLTPPEMEKSNMPRATQNWTLYCRKLVGNLRDPDHIPVGSRHNQNSVDNNSVNASRRYMALTPLPCLAPSSASTNERSDCTGCSGKVCCRLERLLGH